MAIRMGIVGCGSIAQVMHLPHLRDMDQFESAALSDVSAAALAAVGDHYGVAARYGDYNQMLEHVEQVVGAGAPEDLKLAYAIMVNSLIHDINALRGIMGEPLQTEGG